MGDPDRHSWRELYLLLDHYAAWTRVLVEWLYLEGMFCIPAATLECGSESAARKMEAAWKRKVREDLWDVRRAENDVIALHREAFEMEEAQNYTDALEKFSGAVGLPCRLAVLTCLDPSEFSDSLRRKVRKILGAEAGEDEDDGEMVPPALSIALLRRWKEFPHSFPGGKFEVSGTVWKGGLDGVRVTSYDGVNVFDVTELATGALRHSLEFMKEHGIQESTPWWAEGEISWKAPDKRVAKAVAGTIAQCQGSAAAKGSVVRGPAREIWAILSWHRFGWCGIFREYGDWKKRPRIAELTGSAPVVPATGAFAGEVVCFTGKLESMEREDAQGLVQSLGGDRASRVTGAVTLVVATRAASSKRAKAEKLGIPIIDEAAFLKRAGR